MLRKFVPERSFLPPYPSSVQETLRNGAQLADASEPNTASHKMLLSDLATLRAASIVLASGSPRRVDMFNALLKLNARVVP